MFENPRRGRQVSDVTTNVPKILDLKSSSEQIFFRKLSLGAPVRYRIWGQIASVVLRRFYIENIFPFLTIIRLEVQVVVFLCNMITRN